MDAKVYTDVRGIRFLDTERRLLHAFLLYSRDFSFHQAPEDIHQYYLFQNSLPSLIVANYSPRINPSFNPNVIITFTSYSKDKSKSIADEFENSCNLDLLTEHEFRGLSEVVTSKEESLFRQLVLEHISLD